MKTDIVNNNLIIGNKRIPLIVPECEERDIPVPYLLHEPYVYRISRWEEAHLLRRTLINGLLPEKRFCDSAVINVPKRKINHPYHLRRFGQEFLKRHDCVMQDGSNMNCWYAYKKGLFSQNYPTGRFFKRTLPQWGRYLFLGLLAGSCFYTCGALLDKQVSARGTVLLWCLTIIASIPFMYKISNFIKDFKVLVLPMILMFVGALINQILESDNANVFIAIWATVGYIGTVVCLGILGIASIILAFTTSFDLFRTKYL